MKPNVIDISHWETVTDFAALKNAGIQAVICKATEGLYYTDDTYDKYTKRARKAGLLVGAYHFGTSENVEKQVDRFLDKVGRDNTDVLLALDWEPNPRGKDWTMSHAQAQEFCQLVYTKIGRWPVLYSGHVIKEAIGPVNMDGVLRNCRLWLAHYSMTPTWPRGTWDKLWLHQYSESGRLPGIPNDDVDLNYYAGPDLTKDWWGPQKPVDDSLPAPGVPEIAVGAGGVAGAFATGDWLLGVAVLIVAAGIAYWVWRKRQ